MASKPAIGSTHAAAPCSDRDRLACREVLRRGHRGPLRGRGPRSARSSARTASSQPSRRRPRRRPADASASASNGTGASSSAAAAAIASSNVPGGRLATAAARRCRRPRCPSGASSADTRRASIRSGVTRAAVRSGVSSASRSASAIACASAAASANSAARTPVSRRSAGLRLLHLSLKSGGGHRIGDCTRAHCRRRRTAGRRPQLHFAPRDAHPVKQQFQMILRVGLFGSGMLVGPERIPFLIGQDCWPSRGPAAPPCLRACARRGASDAATAGAVVVMPAATVKPDRRRFRPTLRKSRAEAGCAGRPGRCAQARRDRRGHSSMIARSRSSESCQCSASSAASTAASASFARIDLLDQQRSNVRARSARQPQRLRAALAPSPRTNSASISSRSQRFDRRRDRLAVVDRLQRAADPLIQLRIADRDQPRQQQPASAGPHERFRDRPHGAVVGKQDTAPRARPSGSLPKRWIRPAASASAKERWAGMVKTAGRSAARSGILECRFGHRNRAGRANVEPQALVDGAKAATFVDRPVPQDVGREWPVGRIAQQALRDHLDAGKHERRDMARARAGAAVPRGPCGNRPGPCDQGRAPAAPAAAARPSSRRPSARRAA